MAETKSELQLAWKTQWYNHGKKGTLAGATGIGKTKPAIDEMMELWNVYLYNKQKLSIDLLPKIFLAVPTEKLRDEGWPEEVAQWYGEEGLTMWKQCVQAECYASVNTVKDTHFDLVIFDEIHWITPASSLFFAHNTFDAIMGMTATSPNLKRDPEKYAIIKQHAPVIFSYSLDQGVEDGVVADFEINVIMMPLDSSTKNITAGTKLKPFLTTESGHYEYLCKNLRKLFMLANVAGQNRAMVEKRIMFATLARTRFIYNLPSKTRMAKKLMESALPDKRTLIFCGSIKQADELCGEHVFHSKANSNGKFEAFKAGEGEYLGVVNAANEGHNIVNLDQAIIIQVNSNERNLVQRIGRAVRAREDHKAIIWIICVQGTADEKWVEKALVNFNPEKIRYFTSKEFD